MKIILVSAGIGFVVSEVAGRLAGVPIQERYVSALVITAAIVIVDSAWEYWREHRR